MFRKRDGTVGFKDRSAMFGRKICKGCDFINGDFEMGDLTGFYNASSWTISTLTPHAGSYCSRGGRTNGTAYLYQDVVCDPSELTLGYYFKLDPRYTVSWLQIWLNDVLKHKSRWLGGPYNVWLYKEYIFPANFGYGTVTIRWDYLNGTSTHYYMYLDSITLA